MYIHQLQLQFSICNHSLTIGFNVYEPRYTTGIKTGTWVSISMTKNEDQLLNSKLYVCIVNFLSSIATSLICLST